MGGGSNSTSSSSTPLNAEQRASTFAGSLSAISGVAPTYDKAGNITNQDAITQGANKTLGGMKYQAPTYVGAGTAQQLNGGDYDKLQSQLTTGYTAPLLQAKATDLTNNNSDLAKRGIWSSGLAVQSEDQINKAYAPQLANAGAQATAQTQTLKQQDLKNVNDFNLSSSAQANSFGMANAQQNYNSAWAPANYIQGSYNGTGGAVSQGSGSGWNFSV